MPVDLGKVPDKYIRTSSYEVSSFWQIISGLSSVLAGRFAVSLKGDLVLGHCDRQNDDAHDQVAVTAASDYYSLRSDQ